MKFGLYRLHEPLKESELTAIEKEYGLPVQIISVYRAWNRCSVKDDLQWLRRLKSTTRDILLTWEPWNIPEGDESPCDQPDFTLSAITSGRYDAYILAFAKELATFPRTVFLRVMHEMNGNWYPWCGTVNGNSPEAFISAWKHIQALVNAEAASRIQWVWCPYASSYPLTPFNKIEDYFPGDESIDWVAIDGYNWGCAREGSVWQSFEQVFSEAYNTLAALSRRPVMIGELASTETGGSKALWLTEAFQALEKNFPRIKALVWFDINKECDWRIASSTESLEAFQSGIKRGLFL